MTNENWGLMKRQFAGILRVQGIRVAFRSIVVICLLLVCSFAKAQVTGQGAISGTVTDTSGAVIVGAHLTITNVETNVSHDSDTNGTGYFEVNDLNPGTYNISASVAGFETLHRQGITLEAAAHLNVPLALKAGASKLM